MAGLLTSTGTASAGPSIEEINEWLQRKLPMVCKDYYDAKIENCSISYSYDSDSKNKYTYVIPLDRIDLRSFERHSNRDLAMMGFMQFRSNTGEPVKYEHKIDSRGIRTLNKGNPIGSISCESLKETQRFAEAIKAAAMACGVKADLF